MDRFGIAAILAMLLGTACQTAGPATTTASLPPNTPVDITLPLGIDAPPPVPADNPVTPAKIELGRLLFFDPRLSVKGNVSCATCHNPVMGFTDGRATSMGEDAKTGVRSAPTVINLAYATNGVFWDGRAATLEDQATGPIANAVEMGSDHETTIKRLNGIPGYREYFKHVFGTEEITIDDVAKAIATFERTILSGNSPWDRYLKGDKNALSPEALKGWELFQSKANCITCHAGFNLTDNGFRNIGVGYENGKFKDDGRYEFTKMEEDRGRFKTPTLRDVVYTAPYMHDGSDKTLEDVIEYYDRGGNKNPNMDKEMKTLKLTAEEKAALVALMKAFSGEGWQTKMPLSFPPDPPAR